VRGIWEDIRDDAWVGVRGGLEGLDSSRDSWSLSLLSCGISY